MVTVQHTEELSTQRNAETIEVKLKANPVSVSASAI
jgi:hypothetical protein